MGERLRDGVLTGVTNDGVNVRQERELRHPRLDDRVRRGRRDGISSGDENQLHRQLLRGGGDFGEEAGAELGG